MLGPYLTALTDSSVEVRVESTREAPAALEVTLEGRDGGGGSARTFDDRDPRTMHVLRATGLEAGTRYAYVVRLSDKPVARGTFTTAPKSGADAPFSFAVYGDDRTDETAHAAIVRALARERIDFLVNTGDLVEDGGRASDWQTFFEVESSLLRDRCLFTAIGNHELYDDRAGANFARYFGFDGRVYGTTRWGNARFFFLNAMHDWDAGEEREWLERVLAAADGEPGLVWRIAVAHHGPWSSGPHGGNAKLLDAKVPELLATHHVDLLFAGHDHIYERGEGPGPLKYVISGGGGAPLYRVAQRTSTTRRAEAAYHYVLFDVSRDAVKLAAHGADGTSIEQCGFTKGSSWDCDAPPAQPSSAAILPLSAQPDPPSAPAPAAAPRCGCSAPGAPASSGIPVLALALVLAWRARRG